MIQSVHNALFLLQTRDRELKRRISTYGEENKIRLESVESAHEIYNQPIEKGQTAIFIIGSDIEDPIQSAQRLHAFQKDAAIIFLADPDHLASLKEIVTFSPFIGLNVHSVDQTRQEELEDKLDEILQKRQQTENYKKLIAETNAALPLRDINRQSAGHEQLINRLMDIAPVGIALVDRKGKIAGWNKEAVRIFQMKESQVLGRSFPALFPLSAKGKLKEYLESSFDIEHHRTLPPLSLKRKADEQVLHIRAASLRYSEETEACLLAIKDVSELEHARQELQDINSTLEKRVKERTASMLAYQKQLRTLASRLSKAEEQERHRLGAVLHDHLGQMLVVIKLKLDSLQNHQLSRDAVTDIEDIKDGMDDLLTYTRDLMTELKPPPSLEQNDIRTSIEWLVRLMKKHDLEVEIRDDGQQKQVDKEIHILLVQSVRELLSNVIRHAGVNQAVIDLKRFDDSVEIAVEDQGRGFVLKGGKLPDRGGFGLFHISERIDLVGGYVKIESEPEKGSRITLRLPLHEDQMGS